MTAELIRAIHLADAAGDDDARFTLMTALDLPAPEEMDLAPCRMT